MNHEGVAGLAPKKLSKIYKSIKFDMSYCFNPHCQKPQNPEGTKFCLACGSKLLLKERYRAIQRIGEGAFGRTFLAVDEDRLNSHCAIKQFWPHFHEFGELQKATELFKQEARRLHDLGEHPQIPTLFASFEQERHLYLVEEFIEGQNLWQDLQQGGVFSESEIQHLLINILPVLQFIHDHQVIHRDIKPENIVRRSSSASSQGKKHNTASSLPLTSGNFGRETGEFVLVDFGISKQISAVTEAKTGTRTGTAGYAPLEQLRGGKAYPSSDLYSLGVTCIHLLTGVIPDDLFDPLEGKWIWRERLKSQGKIIYEPLAKILDKLLQDLVKERYQSAADVLQDLSALSSAAGRKNQTISPVSSSNTLPPLPFSRNNSSIKVGNRADEIDAELEALKIELNQTDPQTQPASISQSLPRVTTNVEAELQSVKAELSQVKLPAYPSQNWHCVRVLTGHAATINTMALSAIGNLLVTGSDDKTVKLWNWQTGQLIHTFFGHSAAIDAVAITPDSRMLLTGGLDRKIIAWHLDTRAMIREFYSYFGSPQSHRNGAVHTIDCSPESGLMASGSADKTIKLWNLRNGDLLQKLVGHSDKVFSVSFSRGERILASGSADKTIRIWRLGTWENIQTFTGHSGKIYTVAFSPDGKVLVSGSDDGFVKLWSMETGALIRSLNGHLETVFSVVVSPNGQVLASGSQDGTVKLWNLQTGELLQTLAGQNPVTFSHDGQVLVSGGEERQILIWQLR